jgi:transcriptional regulator with XRE-family HTH domain
MGLTNLLKEARRRKRLSQRALSAKIGVPQSHISKIESGQVDLKASSLIELARVLDLEIMLVPRNLVPAIEALSRPIENPEEKPLAHGSISGANRSLPAYRLNDGDDDA